MDFDPRLEDAENIQENEVEPQAIDIEALVKEARRSRVIEEADVQAILASADEEQADRLYEQLQRLGIRIVSDEGETIEDMSDANALLEAELEEEDDEDETRPYVHEAEDDPVHTYLKEIGQVSLLTAEQEIWLATQLAAATTLERLTTQVLDEDGQESIHARTIMANYQSLLDNWIQADEASQILNSRLSKGKKRVELPNLSLIIREAQQLRQSWQSSSPSYMRHYLNDGEWSQVEEWSDLAKSVFAIFTALYLMPIDLSDEL